MSWTFETFFSILNMANIRRCRFHSFFAAMDNVKNSRLLYLSSVGTEAVEKDDLPSTKSQHVRETALEEASSDEAISGAEDG